MMSGWRDEDVVIAVTYGICGLMGVGILAVVVCCCRHSAEPAPAEMHHSRRHATVAVPVSRGSRPPCPSGRMSYPTGGAPYDSYPLEAPGGMPPRPTAPPCTFETHAPPPSYDQVMMNEARQPFLSYSPH